MLNNRRHSIMAIILILLGIMTQSANAEYYYCRLGSQNLTICDSFVTLKFNPSFPTPDYDAFVYRVTGLAHIQPPELMGREFLCYKIAEGYTSDSVLAQLRIMPEVLHAFPTYRDDFGNIYKMTDIFNISYKSSVNQFQIDSIQQLHNVQLLDGPLSYTGTRIMAITAATTLAIGSVPKK